MATEKEKRNAASRAVSKSYHPPKDNSSKPSKSHTTKTHDTKRKGPNQPNK